MATKGAYVEEAGRKTRQKEWREMSFIKSKAGGSLSLRSVGANARRDGGMGPWCGRVDSDIGKPVPVRRDTRVMIQTNTRHTSTQNDYHEL